MKICIVHFRLGLTDGVSLQIDERIRILRQFGHKVCSIAGSQSPIGDLKINYLDYKNNRTINSLQKKIFGGNGSLTTEDKKSVRSIARAIEMQMEDFWESKRFTLIFVHNLFSLPVCLPATIAVYNFLNKHPQIKAVGVHHDFYWDPPRTLSFYPKDNYAANALRKYFPPKLPNLTHTVLSKWEKERLLKLEKIDAEVITDTFDFDQNTWSQNPSNKQFLNDIGLRGGELVLLLASRIRPRKGIELGIEFTAALGELTEKKVVLVLPNDYTLKEEIYVRKLKNLAEKLKVKIAWLQNLVGSEDEKNMGIKKYSLWDCYVYSDAVLYPSLWEGFGNQFLEAVFARKPIASLEYPVFKTDVKPAGFETLEIPSNVTYGKDGLAKVSDDDLRQVAGKLLKLLDNKRELKRVVEKNFSIGKKKFNTKTQLRKYLHDESEKYLKTNGTRDILSPLLLSGRLVASGISFRDAYDLAESVISEVPKNGIGANDFFSLVVNRLPKDAGGRYVTLELVKAFLTSKKSRYPLFIFLGGLAGKSTLANFIVTHLGIDQPLSFDKEKYNIARPGEAKPYLLKATYESVRGYTKTVEDMYPRLIWMMGRNLFDYNRYKKWCYFWEGIYLSSNIISRINDKYPEINYLSVFNLPKFSDVRKRYLLRWQGELGLEKLKKRKNAIDKYLRNVSAIRAHITEELDPVASFVIESSVIEEQLSTFYAIFFQKLIDIANREIPGWVEKVIKNPKLIGRYKKYLKM